MHLPEETEGPHAGSLEWRASLALKILAGVNAAGIVLALIPGAVPSSELQTFAFHVASGALAILYVVIAKALDRRQPWAVSAIRPLLVALLLWGAYTLVSAIAAGQLRIPFTALASGWALFGSVDRRPLPGFRGRGAAVLLASVALMGLELAGPPVFGWGGYFDVHDRDLKASLVVDCGTPGAGLPERVALTYTWSWSSNTLLANENDVVVIGWNGNDAGGHPLYVFGETADDADGVSLGTPAGVSATMTDKAAGHWGGSLHWVLDLKARGIRSGRITLTLTRAVAQPPLPQPLTVGASYIHVGVWQKDAQGVTCSW